MSESFNEENYKKAIEWLFVQAPNYQIEGQKAYKPGLDNIRLLCDFFGNPQEELKMIHIGGTNGKGSVSNMLSSILQEAGYKVGLYNSPHLIDFTERIKVNGKNADTPFVFEFIQRLKELPESIRPSFFEFTTIMAFEYFRREKVDVAIIEVGLGGRLDSTNIIQPLVCAITNVDLDHQNILGNTKAEIAVEKAGIIKKNVPVISGDEDAAVKRIIAEKAAEMNAPFRDASVIETALKSDLKGIYQQKNIKVVLALVEELQKKNFKISKTDIEQGLLNVHQNTGFIGRWFQFSDQPLTICDTAHNQAGLTEVFSQLKTYKQKKHIVLGFVNDKKIDEVIPLLPKEERYYFVKPSIERGRHPSDYENLLKCAGVKYEIFEDVNAGYQEAKKNAAKKDLIFVGGSNFVVGEFLEKNLEK